MLKRIFDIVFASIGILVLSPLFIIIAILIKLTSQGTILFKQERIGLYGTPFTMHKFRTMVPQAESLGLKITTANDPRVTKIGRVLRKSKLDELPQLVDVLIGNMSFVGPRPEVAEYVELYPIGVKELVLSVRPGITDWASIAMIDEAKLLDSASNPREIYIQQIMPQKLGYAIKYVNTHNLFVDIKIIIVTLAKIFSR